jgi:hypothetical protein
MSTIRKLAFAAALAVPFALAPGAFADGLTTCTAEANDKWKPIEEISKMVTEQGYEVASAKVEGSCYEIYAKDKDGKMWELFHNPVDGKLVEKEEKKV